MNEKLQFSWGHIIAFLALIAVSYISFVGFTYLTNGNFTIALIGMGITDVIFILFFIGAQQMKASGVKLKRKIIWERIFIFGSPVIFIAGMISMSHFWTVRSQNDEIVSIFTTSINDARQLFSDYENYSNTRIENYERGLNHIIANKESDKRTFIDAGFENNKANIQKDNMIETLRLQLLSQNYDSLRNVAEKWIDGASHGASTWNVFLLGNTREIRNALANWEKQLKSFSAKEMSNESLTGNVSHFQSDGAKNAIAGIESLTVSFTKQGLPTIGAIIFGVIIYLMLLFPYILQDRHTKNIYRIIGTENTNSKKKLLHKQSKVNSTVDTTSNDSREAILLNLEEDNDYPSF